MMVRALHQAPRTSPLVIESAGRQIHNVFDMSMALPCHAMGNGPLRGSASVSPWHCRGTAACHAPALWRYNKGLRQCQRNHAMAYSTCRGNAMAVDTPWYATRVLSRVAVGDCYCGTAVSINSHALQPY